MKLESTWKYTTASPGGRTGRPVSSEISCATVRQQVFEPLPACECLESWSYKETTEHGCAETEDWAGNEWCYVSNPDECPTSKMSTIEGEIREWTSCNISPFENEFNKKTKYDCEAAGAWWHYVCIKCWCFWSSTFLS